ncbi:DMT family transporter [Plantibacter cousiniae (nom. nud.)]|uniref:DMT family transporter n=1 Tax=Plantibacter cousiniae (nom. nud.) TaxID=199709 RepID=UPI001E2F3C13|nr:DMT family transporter [Plantibacter cousiniae]
MSPQSSVIVMPARVLSRSGLGWGFIGVLAFSFTVPVTKVALVGLPPLFIGSGRAVVAALLAAITLATLRARRPTGVQWARVAIVAGGVVVGFPLLTSFALTTAPAGHSAVVIGLLPAATAVAAVLRGGERPTRRFWIFAGSGAVAAMVFASVQHGGLAPMAWSDLLLLGAVVAAAVGYAEGGLLARELGSWQTISWALVVAAPLMVALTALSVVQQPPTAAIGSWLAFGYLGVVSMFLGFFAWYRGLAIGPISRVSQIQLVQPVLSIVWAALILRERLDWATVLGGLAVILCAGLAVRTRLDRK